MANDIILSNIHNQYLSAYAPKGASRYDTHKKSELRSIYNSIVKLNKESPLYKLDTSRESRVFAVGIKEDARALHNVISSLNGSDEDNILDKKLAYSDNEDIASATFIGDDSDMQEVPSFELEVHSLASGQVNIGSFLPNSKVKLASDTYSFDININDLNYEFQYNIREGETNRDIHNRLARLITNADIGLKADVMEDGNGNSALRLQSASLGLRDNASAIFTISDEHTSKRSGSVSYFGIDYLARPASNADFLLNGSSSSSRSNQFTVGNLYEVHLNGVSSMEGETATIGLKTDVESLTDNISTLVKSYNTFLANTTKYTDNFMGSRRLMNEMKGIASKYRSDFDNIGLQIKEDGTLEMDARELKHAALSDEAKKAFSPIREFSHDLIRKTNQISLNPMDYANKVIVAYKNPGKNFATPYITSAYSGMLFSSYC